MKTYEGEVPGREGTLQGRVQGRDSEESKTGQGRLVPLTFVHRIFRRHRTSLLSPVAVELPLPRQRVLVIVSRHSIFRVTRGNCTVSDVLTLTLGLPEIPDRECRQRYEVINLPFIRRGLFTDSFWRFRIPNTNERGSRKVSLRMLTITNDFH